MMSEIKANEKQIHDGSVVLEEGSPVEQIEVQPASPEYPSRIRLLFITPGIMAVALMVALDNYILATAIPRIANELHGLSAVGWYASSYFLTQMAFQPAFGTLFSTLSTKWLLIFAMLIFEIGSIICATATISAVLIFGRLIAGAGGAGLYVGTLAMVAQVIPLSRRPFYLSLVTSMFGLASITGPLLGGVFTDSHTLTWRFCFWINLPIGFVAILLIGLCYKDSMPRAQKQSIKSQLTKLDLPGLVFLLAAFVCFIFAMQYGGIQYPWSNAKVWGCLLGFGLLSIGFVLIQYMNHKWSINPSIPIHIISNRSVAACCCFILFISMSVGSLIYYLPFYFQTVKRTDASQSGIQNLPFLVVMLFSPLVSGSIASLSGFYVPFMWLGPIISAVGSGLLSSLHRTSPHAQIDIYQVLAGLGIGLCTQLPFTAVQAILPPDLIIMASSLVSLCNSLGPILGTNIAQSIFANILKKKLDRVQGIDTRQVILQGSINTSGVDTDEIRDIFASALTRAYLVPTACCCIAFCTSIWIKHVNIRSKKTQTALKA